MGVATKLFPIAAVPAFLRVVKRPVQWVATIVGVLLLVNVPVAVAAFRNWEWFFKFSSKRPPDFSIWNATGIMSIGLINAASLAALAAAALVVLRHGTTAWAGRLGTAFVIAVWMTINKVGSPQYALWLFAVAAMVGTPWSIFGALVATSMFDFSLELWLMPHHTLALRPLVASWSCHGARHRPGSPGGAGAGYGSRSRSIKARRAAAASIVIRPGGPTG